LPAIDVDAAAAEPDTTVLLDVREYEEWMAGHAPTATHIAMSQLAERVVETRQVAPHRVYLPQRQPLGPRHRMAAQQGFDAVNMTGGMSAWSSFGHPLVNHAGHPGVVI
jgi:rhodanese-related sulfurtransferase